MVDEPIALCAARSWLAVGAPFVAWKELDSLPEEERATVKVFVLRIHILLATGHYESAAKIALTLIEGLPGRPDLHFLAARAQARLGLVEEARENVRTAAVMDPSLGHQLTECADLTTLW